MRIGKQRDSPKTLESQVTRLISPTRTIRNALTLSAGGFNGINDAHLVTSPRSVTGFITVLSRRKTSIRSTTTAFEQRLPILNACGNNERFAASQNTHSFLASAVHA